MTPVVVRRSAWRMWRTSLLSIPLIVLAVDVLTQRRITDWLRELLFRPDDTQLFEFRDVVWAWAMLVVAGGLALWSLRDLIAPVEIVRADESGLRLRVDGPFRPAVFVAWSDVDDLGSASVDDEGETLPVLWVRFVGPGIGPAQPWSARWMDETTLAILATDWESDPIDVAAGLADVAVAAVQHESADENITGEDAR